MKKGEHIRISSQQIKQQRILEHALPPIIKNLKIVKSFSSNQIFKQNNLIRNHPIEINRPPIQKVMSNNNSNKHIQIRNIKQPQKESYINIYLDKLLEKKSESNLNQNTGRYSSYDNKSSSTIRDSNSSYLNRLIDTFESHYKNEKLNKGNSSQNHKGPKVEYNFLNGILNRIHHKVEFISPKGIELYQKEVENIINEETTNVNQIKNNRNTMKCEQNKNRFHKRNFTSYGIEINPLKIFPSHSNASNYEEIIAYKKTFKQIPPSNVCNVFSSGFNSFKNSQLRKLILSEPSLLSFFMKNQNKKVFNSILVNKDDKTTTKTRNRINSSISTKDFKNSKNTKSTDRLTKSMKDYCVNYSEPNTKHNKQLMQEITNRNNKTEIIQQIDEHLQLFLPQTVTDRLNTNGEEINIIKHNDRYKGRKMNKEMINQKKQLKNNKNDKELSSFQINDRNNMVKKLIKLGRNKARDGINVILNDNAYRTSSFGKTKLEQSQSILEIKNILNNSAKNINNRIRNNNCWNFNCSEKRLNEKSKTVIVLNLKNIKQNLSTIKKEFYDECSGILNGNNNNNIIVKRNLRRTKTQIDIDKGREDRKRRLSFNSNEFSIIQSNKKFENENNNIKDDAKEKEDEIWKAALKIIKERQLKKGNLNLKHKKKHKKKHPNNNESEKSLNKPILIFPERNETKKVSNIEEQKSDKKESRDLNPKRSIRVDNSQILSAINLNEEHSPSKIKLRNIVPQAHYSFRRDSDYFVKNQRLEGIKINSNISEERKHYFKDLFTYNEIEKRKQVLLMKIGHDISYGISKGELDEKEQMLFEKFKDQIASMKATDNNEYVEFLEENFVLFQEELEDIKKQREDEKRINNFVRDLNTGLNKEKSKQIMLSNKARVVDGKMSFVSSKLFNKDH